MHLIDSQAMVVVGQGGQASRWGNSGYFYGNLCISLLAEGSKIGMETPKSVIPSICEGISIGHGSSYRSAYSKHDATVGQHIIVALKATIVLQFVSCIGKIEPLYCAQKDNHTQSSPTPRHCEGLLKGYTENGARMINLDYLNALENSSHRLLSFDFILTAGLIRK